jgi:PIN domain nuclease of toxin-antitoxin system
VSATLLDTHTLLWLVGNDPQLSSTALAQITTPGVELFFSYVSAWEIAIKYGLGKLSLPDTPEVYLTRHLTLNRIRYLPISTHAIFLAGRLPFHHRDPFDRLIVAQCLHADLTLISRDAQLDAYGARRVW